MNASRVQVIDRYSDFEEWPCAIIQVFPNGYTRTMEEGVIQSETVKLAHEDGRIELCRISVGTMKKPSAPSA